MNKEEANDILIRRKQNIYAFIVFAISVIALFLLSLINNKYVKYSLSTIFIDSAIITFTILLLILRRSSITFNKVMMISITVILMSIIVLIFVLNKI